MKPASLVMLVSGLALLASCDRIFGLHRPPEADADVDADGTADASMTPDAPSCMTDGFDGNALASTWFVLAGAIPVTYGVSGSRLTISDAPYVTTPSTPGVSWIYDLDTDKGNQIAWPQAIGGEDFTLTADIGWSSSLAELTLGGVGVSDAQGGIAALVGMTDGSPGVIGTPIGRLHVTNGTDRRYSGAMQEPGSSHFVIRRAGGMASITIDGAMVLAGALPDLISNVVVFYVRYKDATGPNPFGSVFVDQIEICRP